MVKISHYEVYIDKGEGWKLEDRFSSDQRYEAIRVAKEREAEKFAVKILKEDFDVQDNSYIETVEYVSLAKKDKHASSGSDYSLKGGLNSLKSDYTIETQVPAETPAGQNVFTAIFKLVAIIVFCLVSANILVTLLIPVIEIMVPENLTQTTMFVVFFALFLLFAVPLVLRKVPWYVFSVRKGGNAKKIIREKKFFDKADAIIQNYNLNDSYEPAVAPAFPEAPAEFKRAIVDYLSRVISYLDSEINISDNFNRLGVKLIIYGGVLELSRYNGLTITHANSMLHEAFCILDGDVADVEAFYEAKKTYKDNKVAIFLTGVGAYLMAQLLAEHPLDTHILKNTFEKWKELNKYDAADNRKLREDEKKEADIMHKCIVSVENRVRFYENDQPGERDDFTRVKSEIRNIIANLASKFEGGNVIEDNYITSVEFAKLNNAARFAVEFFKDVSIYEDKIDNANLIIADKCSILSLAPEQEPNLSPYIQDVFEQTYDNEIIVNEAVKEKLEGHKFAFEFLGEKTLSKTGYPVSLYKLIEQ